MRQLQLGLGLEVGTLAEVCIVASDAVFGVAAAVVGRAEVFRFVVAVDAGLEDGHLEEAGIGAAMGLVTDHALPFGDGVVEYLVAVISWVTFPTEVEELSADVLAALGFMARGAPAL